MPTPVAHALAGIAVARLLPDRLERTEHRNNVLLTVVCVLLATAPDLDLLYGENHRTFTHSIPGTLLVTIISIAVTGWVTRSRRSGNLGIGNGNRRSNDRVIGDVKEKERSDDRRGVSGWPEAFRVGLVCGAAWGSHLLLDWLGTDLGQPSGIQAWWPYSREWFISGIDLFAPIERRWPFSMPTIIQNLIAVAWETVIMGPLVLAVWWRARRGREVAN